MKKLKGLADLNEVCSRSNRVCLILRGPVNNAQVVEADIIVRKHVKLSTMLKYYFMLQPMCNTFHNNFIIIIIHIMLKLLNVNLVCFSGI